MDIARDSVPENRRTQFKIMASNINVRVCAGLYANFLMGPCDGLRRGSLAGDIVSVSERGMGYMSRKIVPQR